MPLAFVACSHFLGRQAGSVEFIGGEDKTTVLVNERLTGGEPYRQSACGLIHDLVRLSALAWTPPLVIAWRGAESALGQEGGLQTLRTGHQGLLGISFTGKGRQRALSATRKVVP